MQSVDSKHERREQWVFVGEVWLTILATIVLLPVLVDLWAYTFTEMGAKMEHGIAMTILWPLNKAREMELLSSTELSVPVHTPLLILAVYAAALTGLAALIDHKPGEQPTLWRRIAAVPWFLIAGPPLLIGALAFTVVAVAADPRLYLTILAVGLGGGLLGQRRRRKPIPWERSLTGLPPAFWNSDHFLRFIVLFGAYATMVLGSSLVGLPFDQTPLATALLMDEAIAATGPEILPWVFGLTVVLAALLAPPTRRASDLMSWEPWVGAGAGALLTLLLLADRGWASGREAFPLGFGLAYLGTLMAGAGVPWIPRLSANPMRALGRLGLPLAAALAVGVHVLATGFLGCESVEEDPAVRFISRSAGASDIEFVQSMEGPALFAAFRAEEKITRFALDKKPEVDLEDAGLRDVLETLGDPTARAHPTLLGRAARGSLVAIYEVIPERGPSSTALVELNPSNAKLVKDEEASLIEERTVYRTYEELGLCGPSSWAWNPSHQVGHVGCRDDEQVLLFLPVVDLGFYGRERLWQAKEVQAIVVDPNDGSVLTLGRRKSPFLTRYDLPLHMKVDEQFVGLSNLRLGLLKDRILLPRFLGRQVLLLDRESLRPLKSRPAGFALASVTASDHYDRAFAGSLVDGHIYSVPVNSEGKTKRIRAGGWISDLSLSPDSRTLYAASMCGIASINLELWLED